MRMTLVIKNYRCFSRSAPARIVIREGFTAFVGPNNSGKSSILKFFYEFRDLLRQIGLRGGLLRDALNHSNNVVFSPQNPIGLSDMASDNNDGPIEIELIAENYDSGSYSSNHVPEKLAIRMPRGGNKREASFQIQGRLLHLTGNQPQWLGSSILQIDGIAYRKLLPNTSRPERAREFRDRSRSIR